MSELTFQVDSEVKGWDYPHLQDVWDVAEQFGGWGTCLALSDDDAVAYSAPPQSGTETR